MVEFSLSREWQEPLESQNDSQKNEWKWITNMNAVKRNNESLTPRGLDSFYYSYQASVSDFVLG